MSGSASAADASTPTMRACARSERTKVTVSAPSSGKFSTYEASPRRKRGSSLRSTRFPRMLIQPSLSTPARAFNSQVRQSEHSDPPPSASEHGSHCGRHIAASGEVRVLERRAEGDRRERRADPPDGRVELVEGSLLQSCRDLGTEPSVRDGLVGDGQAVGSGSRLDDSFESELYGC